MSKIHYTLEPWKQAKRKYVCPQCGKKTFTKYVLSDSGIHIGNDFGRCDREVNCGYFRKPDGKNYAYKEPIPIEIRTDTMNVKYVEYSMQKYENNHFVGFLLTLFDEKTVIELIEKYRIGTSKYWDGSTVFWQIDYYGKVRTGKIMLYKNGHRVKNRINWCHSVMNFSDYHLTQCLFGEHLLRENTLPIAIVESEKTAIICSVFYPKYLWLATGGLQNINQEKFNILRHKEVLFVPDVPCFDKWTEKVNKLSCKKNYKITNELEKIVTLEQIEKGYDICDFALEGILFEI